MKVLLVCPRRDLRPELLEALEQAIGGVVWTSTLEDARSLVERQRPLVAILIVTRLDPAALRALHGLASGGALIVAPTVQDLEPALEVDEVSDVVAGIDRSEEIVFRARMALRRLEAPGRSSPEHLLRMRVGCAQLLHPERALRIGCEGEVRELTTGEGVVLGRLLSRRGAVVSREELSWAVTARPALPDSRGIDSIVSRLRRKLRCRNGCAHGSIRAVRSRGYRLE